jgi:cobyrinic acid a,c-diamide synthase
LVPVAERAPESVAAVDALAELVKGSIDLAAVERIAREAPVLAEREWSPQRAVAESAGESAGGPAASATASAPVVAIASGAAFTFSYAEHAELLAAAGAQVVPFDPLHDEKLPDGTRALVIGGGFPEIYAPELSANAALREAVRRLAEDGGVIAAECAGLLYLAESLDGAAMCGLLPAAAAMTKQLTLGYREAVAPTDNLLCDAGARVAGHEFHRTRLDPVAGGSAAWLWAADQHGGHKVAEGYAIGRVHASYLHLHWAGTPSIASRIVQEAAAWTP